MSSFHIEHVAGARHNNRLACEMSNDPEMKSSDVQYEMSSDHGGLSISHPSRTMLLGAVWPA